MRASASGRLNPTVPVVLYAIAGLLWLFAAVDCTIVVARAVPHDWQNFWAAGGTVGTPALLNFRAHAAWQVAHSLVPQAFVYPPAVAWLFAPLAHVSLRNGYYVDLAVMLVLTIAATVIAARTYKLTTWTAGILLLGWSPLFTAIVLGQNISLALLLELLAILAFIRNRQIVAGLAIGAMLYKPVDIVGFALLIIVRKQWKACATVLVCAVIWYLLSVPASGGDWSWPSQYVNLIDRYYGHDFASRPEYAISVTGILLRFNLPSWLIATIGVACLAFFAKQFKEKPALQAASFAPLASLIVSPHAWSHESALALPTIMWLSSIRSVALEYAIAPLWIFSWLLRFNPLTLIIVGESASLVAGKVE
jgi:Glycosyltransferase family 87